MFPVIKANTVLFWHAQTRISPSITRRGNLRAITQQLGCLITRGCAVGAHNLSRHRQLPGDKSEKTIKRHSCKSRNERVAMSHGCGSDGTFVKTFSVRPLRVNLLVYRRLRSGFICLRQPVALSEMVMSTETTPRRGAWCSGPASGMNAGL